MMRMISNYIPFMVHDIWYDLIIRYDINDIGYVMNYILLYDMILHDMI